MLLLLLLLLLCKPVALSGSGLPRLSRKKGR